MVTRDVAADAVVAGVPARLLRGVAVDDTEPLALVAQHFVPCIQSGERPLTDGEAGLRVVRLLEAASASLAQQGREMRLAAAK